MTNYAELLNSPSYKRDAEVVEVSLLWLIQNITGSCDYEEEEYEGSTLLEVIMASKTSDTGMGHLLESMLAKGHMPEGAIGIEWQEGCYIQEGHHRLCAAILLGLDKVWVSRYGKSVPAPRGATGHSLVCAHYNDHDPYPIHLV